MSLRLVPEAQQSAREYLEVAQPVFAQALPGQDFFSLAWDVRPLRARKSGRAELRFTRYGSRLEALPAGEPGLYAEVIKAFLIVERNGLSNLVMRFDAARFLWEALALRLDDPRDFRWAGVEAEDFHRAEAILADRLAPATVYRMALQLQVLANTLASRGIIPEPRYRPATPKPSGRGGHADLDPTTGDDAGRHRLLSPAALEAIRTVYQDPQTPEDELLISLVALLIAGSGLRGNEVLTLPDTCEVTEGVVDEDGKDYRWGLRFFKEKSPGGQRMLAVRGCTPAQQEIARHALERIRRITDAPRKRAAVLEANHPRVPLPEGTPEELTAAEVAALLGCSLATLGSPGVQRALPRRSGPRHRAIYLRSDVEAYLAAIRGPLDPVLETRGGPPARLSNSLCVVFKNFFHPGRGTNPLLVEGVTIQHLNDFLAGRYVRDPQGDRIRNGHRCKPQIRSVFERRNLREADRSFVRLTTHDLRHWITTVAKRGGLSNADLMGLQNREHAGDLDRYTHLTARERIDWLKRGIQTGRIQGALAVLYFQIAEEERDAWLDAHVQAVHDTGIGYCTHDFSVEPCPFALNCLKQCPDYAVDLTDPKQKMQLVQLRDRTKQALQCAQNAVAEGIPRAESWARTHEETLQGAETALRAFETADPERLPIVRPFAGQPSRYEPDLA
jgi:hypothetical protein